MVDVGVGQHHHVDVSCPEPEVPIAFDRFRTASLKQSTVEENASLFRVDDVARSGYVATHGSDELNLHAALSSFGRR
jgi:hypothetical protein